MRSEVLGVGMSGIDFDGELEGGNDSAWGGEAERDDEPVLRVSDELLGDCNSNKKTVDIDFEQIIAGSTASC